MYGASRDTRDSWAIRAAKCGELTCYPDPLLDTSGYMAKHKQDPELVAKVGHLQEELRKLAKQMEGMSDETPPRRGPGADIPEERLERVRALIRVRPLYLREIIESTGWAKNEIGPILTNMQRHGELIVNLGKGNEALWYLPSRVVAEQILDRLLELDVRSVRLGELLREASRPD